MSCLFCSVNRYVASTWLCSPWESGGHSLLSMFFVPDSVISTWCERFHLNFTTTEWGRCLLSSLFCSWSGTEPGTSNQACVCHNTIVAGLPGWMLGMQLGLIKVKWMTAHRARRMAGPGQLWSWGEGPLGWGGGEDFVWEIRLDSWTAKV